MPARAVATPPRDIALIRGADGTVTLHVALPPGATALNLDVKVSSPVTDVTVAGKPTAILTHPGEWTHLRWQAAPEGVSVTFKPMGPGAISLDYGVVLDHWPVDAKPLPAMPPNIMAWDRSGSTVLIGARTLTWISPSKTEPSPPPRRWIPSHHVQSQPGLGARPQARQHHPATGQYGAGPEAHRRHAAGHAGRHGQGPVRIYGSHKHAHAVWRPASKTAHAHAPKRWTPRSTAPERRNPAKRRPARRLVRPGWPYVKRG